MTAWITPGMQIKQPSIYGSSIARDVGDFAISEGVTVDNPLPIDGVNGQLNIPGLFVVWIGIPGLKLATLGYEQSRGRQFYTDKGMQSFLNISHYHPDLAFFLWGGNDMDNGEDPRDVMWTAITLAESLDIYNCLSYISSVVPRPTPKFISPYLYKIRSQELNDRIQTELEGPLHPSVKFKQLKKFTHGSVPIHRDGIHLNDVGNKRLYHNIRKTVIEGLKIIQ